MRNKRPGICYRCGRPCCAGDGHFEKVGPKHRKLWPEIKSTWLVQHAECALRYRGTNRHYLLDGVNIGWSDDNDEELA